MDLLQRGPAYAAILETQPYRGHIFAAFLEILSDGIPRSADDILAEGIARTLFPKSATRKRVYTATRSRNRYLPDARIRI